MKGRFLVNVKIGEEVFFSSEKNLKGVCEWEMAYEENPNAEEFKVYEKNNDGLTYSLIHSTYKRKIGFQEVKKMALRKNTPCDCDGFCPYDSQSWGSCEWFCGKEEPQDNYEDWEED